MYKKKIEKIDLSKYMGYVPTRIEINRDVSIHVLLQRIENKLNEIIERLNGER